MAFLAFQTKSENERKLNSEMVSNFGFTLNDGELEYGVQPEIGSGNQTVPGESMVVALWNDLCYLMLLGVT